MLWTWVGLCLAACVVVALLHQFALMVLFLLLAVAVPVAAWLWLPRIARVPQQSFSSWLYEDPRSARDR